MSKEEAKKQYFFDHFNDPSVSNIELTEKDIENIDMLLKKRIDCGDFKPTTDSVLMQFVEIANIHT